MSRTQSTTAPLSESQKVVRHVVWCDFRNGKPIACPSRVTFGDSQDFLLPAPDGFCDSIRRRGPRCVAADGQNAADGERVACLANASAAIVNR